MALLSKYIAWDLTGYDVDGPVPVVPQDRGAPTRSALLSDTARAEGPHHPPALSAHRRRPRPLSDRRLARRTSST